MPPDKNIAPPAWAAELSDRERRFVEEYIVDLNGRAAAIRAGLGKTVKSATEIASRIRKKPHVAAAISQLMAERTGVTSVAVIDEIAKLAFAKLTDVVQIKDGSMVITDTSQLSEDQQAAISEITETVTEAGRTIRVRMYDKIGPLEQLAKMLGLYKKRIELSGPGGGPIPVVDVKAKIAERLKLIEERQRAPGMVEILPPLPKPKSAA